ncbi:MAG: hypothetical protein R3F56_15740 [Planctomycetota bacterium]
MAGCVVVEEAPAPPEPLAVAPVAIPFVAEGAAGGATPQPHDFYYQSVVTQLQQAWIDRDRAYLARLLDTHDRADAPPWAQERMQVFRNILTVMDFEETVRDRGRLDLPEPLPALGEPLRLTMRLGPLPGVAVRLLGGDDPARARFILVFRLVDRDAFGDEVANSNNLVLDLSAPVDFAAGQAVEVPVAVDVPSQGSILRRVELEVFWMPGHVEIDGINLPNRKVRCAVGQCELLPRGIDKVEAQPRVVLEAALRLGDAAHFPHVYLAARELARAGSDADRETATAKLVDRVRLGSSVQARSAMAALGLLHPDAVRAAADRTAWLQWWAQRAGR